MSRNDKMTIKYKTEILAKDVIMARDFWTRLSGYMFRKNPHVPAILFEPAGAIQTTFMRFDLDILFLSNENRVLKTKRGMKPWRFIGSCPQASKTLEVPSGVVPPTLKVGDVLELVKEF